MKVLLFTDFGTNYLSPEMIKILGKNPFPINRTGKIIEFVEQIAVPLDKTEGLIPQIFKEKSNTIIKIEDQGTSQDIYIIKSDSDRFSRFAIQEVDTTRPWTIENYDGAEYIQYLDYNIINSDINYCVYKE